MAASDDVKSKPEPKVESVIDRKRRALVTVRERMHRSRLALEGTDPNMSYYWGSTDPRELTNYQLLGFEVCKDKSIKASVPQGADGTFVIGDAILMKMPRDEYEAIQTLNQLKSEENIDAAIEKLLHEMEEQS